MTVCLTTNIMNIDGCRLRTGHFGRDGAPQTHHPPALILNGMGCAIESLHPLVEALRLPNVVTFDVPGVGDSPLPFLPYRFGDLAMLVENMLNEMGYETVDIIGNSWGGALAQQIARDFPDRCRRLVLLASTSGVITTMPNPVDVMSTVLGSGYPSVMSGIPMGEFYQLGAIAGWTSEGWLSTLKQETLVLAAGNDTVVPAQNVARLARGIPGAEYEVIEGDHMAFLHYPSEAAERIRVFLNK